MAAFDAPTTVVAAALRTVGTVNSASLNASLSQLNVVVNVTAITGTLDVKLQWSHDDGTTWADAETADSFTQINGIKAVAKRFTVKAPSYRVVHTVGGTSANYSVSVYETLS